MNSIIYIFMLVFLAFFPVETSFGQGHNVCDQDICFKNKEDYQRFIGEYECVICARKVLDQSTECCVYTRAGTEKIVQQQIVHDRDSFNWEEYRNECGDKMRPSTAGPDALWRQCVVGRPQSPNDEWPVVEIVINKNEPIARPFCIDGCSTPQYILDKMLYFNRALENDKDNPIGEPGSSFFDACRTHDICYQTCSHENRKEDCDNNFHQGMLDACNTIPEDRTVVRRLGGTNWTYNVREVCRNAAWWMVTGVEQAGGSAYNLRKKQYCRCC